MMVGGGENVSPQILQQLGIDGPLTNTVHVSNVSGLNFLPTG